MPENASPMRAQDKLTFLLALVPFLLDHERVSVAETAEHFGVDQEQIREAVRLIAVSGVPGDTSQYLHGDLFDIAWDDFEDNDRIAITNRVAIDDSPRFSAREAAALIAGLQYLSALPENADHAAIGSLMAKLTHGASASPSQVAVAGTQTDESLRTIRAAVGSGTRVEFGYLNSRGEQERRRVDPLRIESIDDDWYLRGWCHLRRAVRTFRLDRMTELVATPEPISYRPSDVSLPDTLFEPSDDDLTVSVAVAESAIGLIVDYIPDGARRRRQGGIVHTQVRVAHYHGLKRLVCRHSGVLTVTAPPQARAIVAEWAGAGLARYGDDA